MESDSSNSTDSCSEGENRKSPQIEDHSCDLSQQIPFPNRERIHFDDDAESEETPKWLRFLLKCIMLSLSIFFFNFK